MARGGGAGRFVGRRNANILRSSSFTSDQIPVSPESSTPETPLSDATVNGSVPFSSSGFDTTIDEIGSNTSSHTVDGTRIPIEIDVAGLEPSNKVARAITKIFKEKLDPEGHNWKSVTPEIKDFYPHELLKKTHTKAADKEEFVDQKSRNTYDAVVYKIASASQPEHESSEPLQVDYSQIYLDEVGGVKRRRIYGLGSQAPLYEPVGASSASTPIIQDFDARVKECVGHRLQEMKEKMKEEMKHEIREAMREELRQELHEEMKYEMQQEVQEQVDEVFHARLSSLVAGLPKPTTRTS